MIPVNPMLAGQTLRNEPAFAAIGDIPDTIPVDTIEIFRRSEYVPAIVEEAIATLPHLQTVWMQIGVISAEGRAMAEGAGLRVIENRCPKIERQRLFGELRRAGFNTGVISSRLHL